MTRNEQIASIMLEAAELLKNDTLNESGGARDKYLKMLADKDDKLKKEIALEKKKIGFGKRDRSRLDKLEDAREQIFNKAEKYSGKVGIENDGEIRKNLNVNPKKKYNLDAYIRDDAEAKYKFKNDLDKNLKRGSKLQQHITKRGERQKALKEAVDLLYERAVLCEDAEKVSSYIEKAEILQEAMSELDSF